MIRIVLLVCPILLAAGCATVGPDYVKPEIRVPGKWNAELKEGLQKREIDPKGLATWWDALGDPVLSGLIARAIDGNPDLRRAEARVRAARSRRGIAGAALFPTVDAGGAYQKGRSNTPSGSAEADLYSVGLDAAWELDIFGGARRSIEAAEGDLEAVRESLRDVLVSLAAETALNYVEARTLQARLAVAEENLDTQQESYRLTRSRLRAGLIAELAVQQARYNLENTRAQIPILRTGREEAMNRLAVLIGEPPGKVHAELEERKPLPATPPEIAVGVPADILRQRPDVRRAERELAAQTARVGAAVSDLYPRLVLNGSIGLDAFSSGSLFSSASRVFGVGTRLLFPVFNAGAIRGNIEAQSAIQEEALIAYESSILRALEEVENALHAFSAEQDRRRSLAEAADAARKAGRLAERQYTAGLIDFTGVLDAQRSLLSFEDQLAQSDGRIASNLIRLYKALGGGWTPL